MSIKRYEEKEWGTYGLRMLREEECVINEEIGVLHSSKRFRPNKKMSH